MIVSSEPLVDHVPLRVVNFAQLNLLDVEIDKVRHYEEQKTVIVRVMNQLNKNGLVTDRVDKNAVNESKL